MKDLSYLEAFSPKSLREARRILNKDFTVEDIDRFLNTNREIKIDKPRKSFLQRPCCNDTDEKLKKFKDKQKLRKERIKEK